MEEHDGRRTCGRCFAKDLSRMRGARIQRADRHDRRAYQPMFRVEHHQAELLDLSRAELRQQIRSRIAWIDELQPRGGTSKQRPPPELDGGEHLCSFRGAHTVESAQLVDRHTWHAVQPAGCREDVVGQGERTAASRSAADDDGYELVVAEAGCAEAQQLFARSILRRQGFQGHAILTVMSRRASLVPVAALLLSSFLSVGCATPPTREMDQAQGSLDAARAAGADRFATEQYDAAVKALQNAHDAVGQRDYRLALNYALDARDRAQRAAKEAATQQGVLRSAAERRLSEVTASLDKAEQQLTLAETARVPRSALTSARAAIAKAEASLQKAGTNIQEGNYKVSQEQLAESARNLEAAMVEMETAQKRRTRPRR